MENQNVLLFRRKNRWGLTVLSVLLCFMLSPLVGMAAMMPQVLALVPVVLLMLLGYVGPVSAVICAGICVGMGGTLFGLRGLLGAVMLFVPVLVVSAVLVDRQHPFWQSVGISAVTMFAAFGAVVGVLSAMAGSDVVTMYTQLVREMFSEMGVMSDALLSLFMQLGMLPVPEGLDLSAAGAALTPQMREETVNLFVYVMDAALRLELPAQTVSGAVICGVLGQALLRKGMLSQGYAVPYPRLRTWRLPKGWGRVLLGTLLVFFIAAQMMPERMSSTFYVFSQMFDMLFAVQGIAAVCYVLHKNGKGKIWRALVCFAGFFVIRSIAVAVGIADQGMDITHRRQELDEADNPYDPFGRKPEA